MSLEAVSAAQIKENLAQLRAYELPESAEAPAMAMALRKVRSQLESTTPDASVVANGVVAFVSGMSEQNKEDVRNSHLYASLVASKRYPRDADGAAWYELFSTVMNQLGWTFIGKHYSRYHSRDTGVSMDQIGLQVIRAIVMSAAVPAAIAPALLKAAGAALETLKNDSHKEPIKLFNRSASGTESGQFTVGSCAEDADGEVIMAFGAVHCRSAENKGNVLFVRWNNASTHVYTGNARMTLSPTVYGMARTLILDRLGRNIESAIASYEI